MESTRACPLCNNQRGNRVSEEKIIDALTYTAYRCGACTVVWWEPFKNPGAAWYGHDERYADRNKHPILAANKKHTDVIAYFKGETGRVLDVGCGVGNFLAHAQEKGWEGWGIDFDPDAIATAKETFNLERVSVSDLQTFAKEHPGLRFDLITFFDVFEHLDNHQEFMSTVCGLLSPRGAIALSVPYEPAKRWLVPADLPPRHLTRSNEQSITQFLKKYNFNITMFKRLPASFYYIVLKFRFRYGRHVSFGAVRKLEGGGAIRSEKTTRYSFRGQFIRILAKAKDIVIFGAPALIAWLLLLPSKGRYTDMYVVARKGN